ncbi:MAG: hypothetical protein WC602_01735 [archaeon]
MNDPNKPAVCEKCFHYHTPSEECFRHNISRKSKDKCEEYAKPE